VGTDSLSALAFAADPGARFITTSFLGLMLDICVMQPSRVLAVAFVMVCCLLSAVYCLLSAFLCVLSAICVVQPGRIVTIAVA
jgi:hypothetical protein